MGDGIVQPMIEVWCECSVSLSFLSRLQSASSMKILICNDDGFQAPGIVALHDARTVADVEVVAPEHNNSAKSNALTLNAPLYVHKV
ncbi:hypothetical protein J4711_13460 [Staphylococcus epidermidis]|nr:hypothetical protein [Staphylococcus epidermidis]